MGLLDFLFGTSKPKPIGRVEDMDDYTDVPEEHHWTVDHEAEDITRDDDWEEDQDQDWGDSWGEY